MEQKHNNSKKVKLLCSYGGKIQSRPTDHQLSYVGGDTKILAVDRGVKFSEIFAKLNSLSNRNDGGEISVKYQLPGEELDSLVSLIDDDDVEHMMVEYDRMHRISAKPTRLRIFVFNITGPPAKPVTPTNPDYLFGFDKEYQPSIEPPALDLLPEKGRFNNVSMIPAAGQAVYRFPVVMNGGVYPSGAYLYGNREQPVYNIIPMVPSVSEQRMIVSIGNSVGMNVIRRDF
ncbi:hypothetical protein C2S51_031886 [Perilla frutescens var. frutescens]|nr:hypothetical protein C2S51_031886 [Perilla frutescens var. frutescens]